MSWFTDAQYKPAAAVCECPDGTYDIMIVDIKIETYQGNNVMAVYLNINCPQWNKIPYKHALYQGDNFDYGFSRLCDCFGVKLEDVVGGNWQPFVNKIGRAEFSHQKQKKVVTGYDQAGRPIEEWKTEKSQYANAKLIAKGQPQQQQPQQQQAAAPSAYEQPLSGADAAGMAQAFGSPSNTPVY